MVSLSTKYVFMQKDQKDRIWYLVSKKLAGEATQAELNELEELLRQHPEMHYAIQHIQDLWKLSPPAAPEADEAFQKHLNKMQEKVWRCLH